MADDETTGEKALRLFGLGTPDTETPVGAAFIAAAISGAVVGGLFWLWRGPGVGLFVFILALGKGAFDEVSRAKKARDTKN